MKLLPVFAAVLVLLLPCGANAFVPEPPPMACMLYFQSDAVFVGQVLSVADSYERDDGDDFVVGWTYTLKVVKGYRGSGSPTIEVYTSNDSGRLPLIVGKTYLLFASNQDGRLTIGYDTLSGELKDAKQTLKDLEKIMVRKPGEGGDVFGRITLQSFGSHRGGVGGIHVTIKGLAGSADAVTNDNGWFRVHLPAGIYSATATDANWTFKPLDITWQNSDSFTLPDGGCAEIQIQADPLSAK